MRSDFSSNCIPYGNSAGRVLLFYLPWQNDGSHGRKMPALMRASYPLLNVYIIMNPLITASYAQKTSPLHHHCPILYIAGIRHDFIIYTHS